jgi:hypothetical protein
MYRLGHKQFADQKLHYEQDINTVQILLRKNLLQIKELSINK